MPYAKTTKGPDGRTIRKPLPTPVRIPPSNPVAPTQPQATPRVAER
jgi:hypothetical protein